MSKRLKTIYAFLFAWLLILQSFSDSTAQTVQAKIELTGSNAAVEGSFTDANGAKNITNLSFLKSYINIENLGARFSEIALFDRAAQKVNYRKLTDGEFLAERGFRSWNYKANLSAPQNAPAMAHVSWVSGEQGILMTGDLFPEFAEKTSAKITFKLPAGWRIASAEKRLAENVFEVADVEKAVFYLGKNLRETEIAAGSARLNLIMAGEWQVSEAEAAQATREIFAFYENLFGGKSFEKGQIFLGKFPAEVSPGTWEAETRGASVTIFSSEMNFKTQSLQRLHEQMRHELFHFWFPNGVNLSGNYDWFYEGFALYQSLKTAVAMKRIRFDDFLDTLSRAHAIDSATRRKTSLVEASKNRWNGANTQVYARGMLVAFLTDVALLQASKGKTSLENVFREIYQKHNLAAAPRADGNTAILNVLGSRAELRKIVESYIKAAETIAWQTDLEAIGIETGTGNFAAKLKVIDKPSGRQKDLLDKLGYNNWRK